MDVRIAVSSLYYDVTCSVRCIEGATLVNIITRYAGLGSHIQDAPSESRMNSVKGVQIVSHGSDPDLA